MKRKFTVALIVLMVIPLILILTLNVLALEPEANQSELLLYIGSPIALSDGKILPLDPNNPGLAPFIHKSRTLVPVRMIAEHFGATVDYDHDAKTALISAGNKSAVFPIGKDYFLLDGRRIDLDTETLLVEGRTFVPIRVICEQILGLQVDYDDSVVYIAQRAKLTDKTVGEVKAKIGMFVKTTSLGALKSAFANKNTQSLSPILDAAPDVVAEAPAATPAPAPAPPTNGESTPRAPMNETGADAALGNDYSSTNIQVEGIDEGDIIKTDGQYIYAIAANQFKIVRAEAGDLSLISSVSMEEGISAHEMYVDKDRVIVIGSRYGAGDLVPLASQADVSIPANSSYTFIKIYDVADKAKPQLIRSFDIQGDMAATRKKGDYIYLVTNYRTWYWNDIDPRPLLAEDGIAFSQPVSNILVARDNRNESVLTVSAVNFKDIQEHVASESITGAGYVTYMSDKALYIAMPDYYSGNEILNIARFSVDGAKIGYKGSAALEGNVNDQFSMDEYEGHLRLATTIWRSESENNLYVLDENMDISGSVMGFAPTERIYSARFMGARGYVVTFRQTDPLFVFDLSDPLNPKITGELTAPGFSNYLHPVSENILLGLGRDVYDIYRRDANGKEVVIGQQNGGLKLSLFDVSDAGRPKEIDTLVLGDNGYSELLYNHKAAMFKQDEGLLAFPADLWSGNEKDAFHGAFLITYQNNKLSERGRISYVEGNTDFYYGDRLVYIGGTLYYMQGGLLRSFELSTLKSLNTIKLVG